MAQSRTNKNRKDKLNKYKNSKKMSEQQNANLATHLPPFRTVPFWDPQVDINVKGFEWEAIQNSLTNIQMGQQAAQSVMSRNILNGTIQLDIEKLNPESLQYEEMTDEEKAPYLEDLKKQMDAVRNPKSQAPPILSETGEPIATENVEKETPKENTDGAKVVKM